MSTVQLKDRDMYVVTPSSLWDLCDGRRDTSPCKKESGWDVGSGAE